MTEFDTRTEIRTESAPAPVGPYSQAIRSGDLLLLSGQIPLDPNVVNGGDEGRPVVTSDPDGPAGAAIRSAADRLLELVPPAAADTCTARIAVLEEQLAGM